MSTKDKNKETEIEEVITEPTSKDDAANQEVAEAQTLTVEEQLTQDLQQEKERYLRLFAEFENYKKRTSKERIELFKTAGQDVMISILPVLDDFDRALNEFSADTDDVHVQGMTLISNKLKEALKQKGLEVQETKVGDVFDADTHEAITQIPAPSDDMKGKIIDTIEKGYTLGDKIIRYPKVVIGQQE
jgi:molecular chaperone GrpE